MTDQEIVTILTNNNLKGGTKALKILYKNNYYMVENYILKNSGTKDDAKDIFQDSVVVFYKNLKKESFQLSGKLSTYMYSIARNLWLKKLRDNRISTSPIEDEKDSFSNQGSAQLDLEFTENQQMIGKLLREAGDRCKNLLKAFYYEKMSMRKIAETQGFSSEQIAKNQKVRCLKKIRAILNNSETYYKNLKNSY
ncbi:MAG: sigma-70 family RNA polymerase sigma factor [Saprospiraceae bacterium]|nr:sigma-70 family RNA polymerase sigma factor [Saprospiraceae bacterium]